MAASTNWIIGIDVGGTFTDFYAFDRSTGQVAIHKRSSTPDNPARAILAGLEELAGKIGIALDAISGVAHGTTVATNALIQRKGGTVAVVTTKNFRDLLEIGRQVRPKLYDLKADYPQPLARREHRFEVDERIGPAGEVIRPVDEENVQTAIRGLAESGAQACAVCFLFSYLNPSHERQVAEAIRKALPGIAISVSSEVQPEFREYERFSTTLLNAYLQPILDTYMSTLRDELARLAPRARVGINQSIGGLMSIDRAREFPIRTALSGPAAGAMGAIHIARLSNRPNLITLDMGGTSADVALISNYDVKLAFNRDVAGFPVRLPMVDINTVGAGGGSIAWFDRDGLLKVGPLSAGADPGPACYRRGGNEATVTDANVVLGRLSSRGLLGGDMSLDVEAARRVVGKIADKLGFSIERTAQGILDIVAANMVRAIRAISVERGYDPRDFVLMPFGGAGPLHAASCARALGIGEIIVPSSPGILSAQGLLVTDLSESWVRSKRLVVLDENSAVLNNIVDEMLVEAEKWWKLEGVPADRRGVKLAADMRYQSQNYELQVPIEVAGLTPRFPDARRLRELFFAAHEQAYGFYNPDDPVEVIAVRLTAIGLLPSPGAPSAPASATRNPEPFERRKVWFSGDEPVDTPIYLRSSLAPGATIQGPAVIDQFDATTLVFPGDIATVDDALNVLIKVGQ